MFKHYFGSKILQSTGINRKTPELILSNILNFNLTTMNVVRIEKY